MQEKCNLSYDGELFIFGKHYTEKECKKIIADENYNDTSEYGNRVQHTFVRKGFVWFEGERSNGWTQQDKYKKGCLKATIIYTDNQNEIFERLVLKRKTKSVKFKE